MEEIDLGLEEPDAQGEEGTVRVVTAAEENSFSMILSRKSKRLLLHSKNLISLAIAIDNVSHSHSLSPISPTSSEVGASLCSNVFCGNRECFGHWHLGFACKIKVQIP